MSLPILYSFRRCPYAIRARMGLAFANIQCELREIVLRDKPIEMLELSPKGTVPVLQLPNDRVLEESLDILLWSLEKQDPECILPKQDQKQEQHQLIHKNDTEFKGWLDRYKYWNRHPEQTRDFYLQQANIFLEDLEQRLESNSFLFGEKLSLADIAIFPFIRQFAHSDREKWEKLSWSKLRLWLNKLKKHHIFLTIMEKRPVWKTSEKPTFLLPLETGSDSLSS